MNAGRDEEAVALATSLCRADADHWSAFNGLALANIYDRPTLIHRFSPAIKLEIAMAYVGRKQFGDLRRRTRYRICLQCRPIGACSSE